jgi:CRP-like cAMP-binding protein
VPAHGGHLGLLVLGGLLSRRVRLGGRVCVELIGEGDVIRPWTRIADESTIPIDATWTVQAPVRLAVLDRAFAVRVAPHPEIVAALMDELVRRTRWLAFHLAVCHLPKLEVRLHVILWYMADRWGRVTPDGVVLPVALSHELLGGIVGARRTAVTRALGRLTADHLVTRRPDGGWLLQGEAPQELPALHRDVTGAAEDEDEDAAS